MILVESLEETFNDPVVLAAGAFDGLHIGHAKVIQTAKILAQKENATLGVLRFHPHPAKILTPDTAPPLLGCESMLRQQLEELGVDVHVRYPFSKDFAKTEPLDFLDALKEGIPNLTGVVVGANWRFGHRGHGDLALLNTWGEEHHVQIVQAEDTLYGEQLVSSTRIRDAVRAGNLETAAKLLGRPYTLTGTVQAGKKLGRELGFPTANFIPEQECLPPDGVYVMNVRVRNEAPQLGAGYITHDPHLVEVHVLDFDGDLYDQSVSVDVLEFRRPATPIPDLDLLRRTIQQDVEGIRADYHQ